MKKRAKLPVRSDSAKRGAAQRTAKLALLLTVCGAGIVIGGVRIWLRQARSHGSYVARPRGTLTFNKDIAPIVFAHCSTCHRPGQSAPFSLLTYAGVRKRIQGIADVTARRFMPPWPPEPGYGEFADARTLRAEEIGLIQQWVAEGGIEGSAADLPPLPVWTGGWQLGAPDLVIVAKEPYNLPAEGKDMYRNFVIPVPIAHGRFVRAVEFNPGNPRVVHHAFVKIDRTHQSRRRDGKDGQPGFPGMVPPDSVQMPEGHFLSWQPGKVATIGDENLAWRLEPNSDLVLQLHLRPDGKAEPVQPAVALYFADKAPTAIPSRILLASYTIDIPPGATNYVVEDSYTLPVDADLRAVLPHTHYLGKEVEGFAQMPDGKKKWLLRIKQWDFNWQGDYRFARPVFLPRGTTLCMRYTFDNSTNNATNPHNPPQRVVYGPNASDEMAELWFQVVVRTTQDLAVLNEDHSFKNLRTSAEYGRYLVKRNAGDPAAHVTLGKALLALGQRIDALGHFRAAADIQPDNDEAHYFLGLVFRLQRKLSEAASEFEKVVRINPDHYKAHGNLGLIRMEQGKLVEAEAHFRSALRINPDDEVARGSLEELTRLTATPQMLRQEN